MKSTILLFISLCFATILQAQVSKTIQVAAGGLKTALTAEELATVTNLTLTGTIDARDFKTMRDDMPVLADIDLTGVNVAGYSGEEGTYQVVTDYPANEIPICAFYRINHAKTSLTTAKLPSEIKSVGKYAFYESGLTSVTVPKSVTSIEICAFGECAGLKAIYLSGLPPEIKAEDCNGLNESFYHVDKSLCVLHVPFGLKLVYTVKSFWQEFAKIVEMPGSIFLSTIVNLEAKEGSTAAANISSNTGWTVNSDKAWFSINQTSGTGSQTLVFTAEANSSATSRSAKITFTAEGIIFQSITVIQKGLPKTLTIAAGGLLTALTAEELTTITSLKLTGTINDRDFETMRDKMPLLEEIDLSGVTIVAEDYYQANEIPWEAFYNQITKLSKTSLTSVILPSSVTSIGGSAFYGCSGLTNFTIPPTVTEIESYAFDGCSGLTSIIIPSSVKSIKIDAFNDCTGLTSIYSYGNTPPGVWGGGYFGQCGEFFCKLDKTKCILFVPYSSTALYAAADHWKDFKNIVEIPFIELSSKEVNIEASQGSEANTNIVSDVSWTASSNQPWLTLNKTSGTGNQTITLTAKANSVDTSRTAIVTISASGVEPQTITVKQWAATTDVYDLRENSTYFKCYPNPFNTVTIISWQLAKTSNVTLKVLDIVGRTVATLVDEQRPEGKYETRFNAGTLPKGVYFCQLKAGDYMQTRKMILLE